MIRKDSVIATNRFGLGARPGELAKINDAPRDWLLDQIRQPISVPAEVRQLPGSAEIILGEQELRMEQRAMRKRSRESTTDKNEEKAMRKLASRMISERYWDQVIARHTVSIKTDVPFYERLVHFWSNHFAISADKPKVKGLAGPLESEAIRPNVTGRFFDLLLAVEKHPAMLLYLDNQNSTGPNSEFARNSRRGLNENLAREILELHTLGVDGGYGQADVTMFAKALTGWSVGRDRDRPSGGTPGEFYFREVAHEPGAVTIMGKTYLESGIDQAKSVLVDLARHSSTARHLATKLARHFISDDPPVSTVTRLEKAFLKSDGDLPTVYAALVEAREAWREPLVKYKTPEDFLISAHRALDVVPKKPRSVGIALIQMGQKTYAPGSPAGWPDQAADWDGAAALIKRIEWSAAAGKRAGRFHDGRRLAAQSLGPVLGSHTRDTIAQAESRAQALTLLLVSPEFLMR